MFLAIFSPTKSTKTDGNGWENHKAGFWGHFGGGVKIVRNKYLCQENVEKQPSALPLLPAKESVQKDMFS